MIMNEEIGEQEEDQPISRTTCSICNKDDTAITDPESGEIICSNCGVVISERIEDDDIHKEKSRAYTTLEEAAKKARTGAPASLARHGRGLYTIIGRDNKYPTFIFLVHPL
jgi:transcription initiation factor TFIIB